MKAEADFHLVDQGSIVLLNPRNGEARQWIDEHIEAEAQWFAGSVVIKPRFVDTIVEAIGNDGLWIQYKG